MTKFRWLLKPFNFFRGAALTFLLFYLGIASSAPGQIADIEIFPAELQSGQTVSVQCKIEASTQFEFALIYIAKNPTVFRQSVPRKRLLVEGGTLLFNGVLKTAARDERLPVGDHAIFIRLLDGQKNLVLQRKLGTISVKENLTTDAAELQRKTLESLTKQFPAPDYKGVAISDWVGSDAGRADVVLPPWTPITAGEQGFEVWNRIYRFGGNALPDRMESSGSSLLSGPVRFEASRDGAVLSGKYQSEVLSQSDTAVTLKSAAQYDGFRVETLSRLEYDGFCYFETTLTPGENGAQIDQLSLLLPIRSEHSTHYMHGGVGTKHVYKDTPDLLLAEFQAAGRMENPMTIPWTYQLMVSGRTNGVALGFLDEKDWSVRNEQEMIDLVPGPEGVLIQARLADYPQEITGPRTFRYYIQALPSRPMLNWQEYEQFYSHQTATAKGLLDLFESRDGERPRIELLKERGVRTLIAHQDWTELQGYPGTFDPERAEILRTLVQKAHQAGFKLVVSLAREITTANPEWKEFAEKMVQFPLQSGRARSEPRAISRRPRANSYYNDFFVHKTRELIREYNIDGVFLDGNCAIGLSFNEAAGFGYRKPDGTWAGTSDALYTREQMRRLYTLFKHEEKKDGLIMGHAGIWNPSFPFMDLNMVGERETWVKQRRPELSAREVLSLDFAQALYNPGMTGTATLWLSKPGARAGLPWDVNNAVTLQYQVMPRITFRIPLSGQEKTPETISPEDLGMLRSVHLWERMIAFDPGEAVWVPFWEIGKYVDISPALTQHQALGMYLVPGKRALLVASNLEPEPMRLEITPDRSRFGFGDTVRIYDPEQGSSEALEVDGRIIIEVPSENFRLLRLEY